MRNCVFSVVSVIKFSTVVPLEVKYPVIIAVEGPSHKSATFFEISLGTEIPQKVPYKDAEADPELF